MKAVEQSESGPFWAWNEMKFSPLNRSNEVASVLRSDVNKDWTCKDKDKDKDFTYSYLLQVAAKPTIAIKQQQW